MRLPEEELVRAARALATGAVMLEHGYAEEAGRGAYMASFHAAQALIIARTGKQPKTHHGVHVEFARMTRTEPGLDATFVQSLSSYYEYKNAADYGSDSSVTLADAAEALATSRTFVHLIRTKLEAGDRS